MNRVAVAVTGASAGTLAAWVAYDYQTCHPMRKMKGYDTKGSWIRLHNTVRQSLSMLQPTFTLTTLDAYDGVQKPRIYFSSQGIVYDVTDSEMFDSAYELWKGKDATFCLARMSIDKNDINRTDWKSLTDKDLESLQSWTSYFDQKYLIKGRLKEYSQN